MTLFYVIQPSFFEDGYKGGSFRRRHPGRLAATWLPFARSDPFGFSGAILGEEPNLHRLTLRRSQEKNRSMNTAPPGITTPTQPKISVRGLDFFYGASRALNSISVPLYANKVTSFIGPSVCGKSTLLRVMNRISDLYPDQRARGEVLLDGRTFWILKPIEISLRSRIGMVFQKPEPFPMSIHNNIAFGIKLFGAQAERTRRQSRRGAEGAALWDEVKDQLHANGLSLSGGQQQRLCIARTVAARPEVILFDEPCSALDPISTAKIET